MSIFQPIPASHVADGEWVRSPGKEGLWVTIDLIGTKRNVASAIQSGSEIAGTSAKIVSAIGGAVVPILFSLAGVMVVKSAISHTLPDAIDEYRGARKAYESTFSNRRETGYDKRFGLVSEGVTVAKLGVANQSLYLTMGSGLIANGTVSLMSPMSAALFGFHPVLATGASLVAGAALGGIYVIRGGVILGRSIYNLHYINKFQDTYRSALTLEGDTQAHLDSAVNQAIGVIKEIGVGTSALKRRIGEKVGELKDNATLEEKIKYLEEVDKGIHEKKLQQKISIVIGLAMFLGGLAAIAALVFSGGLALPIIALISAIAFTLMEGVFAAYDSSAVFEKLRAWCYKPSEEIVKLRALHTELELRRAIEEVDPPQKEQPSYLSWLRHAIGV